MTRGMQLLGASALFLLAALVAFYAASDTRAAPPPFNPGGMLCFENLETANECDGDSAGGAASDIRTRFCVGWGPACDANPLGNLNAVADSNFGLVVGFSPVNPSPPTPGPLIGSIAGYLTSTPVLGLLGANCSTNISVAFSLMYASVDLGNTISPKEPGKPNAAEPLALDNDPKNGIPDGADKYPSYLKTFFKDKAPLARLFGVSKIQGGFVTLNFVYFEPGARIQTTAGGGTDNTFKAELGVPGITILQDPTTLPAPGPISDFCAPLVSANMALGKTMDNPCTPLPSPAGANCPGGPVFENKGYPMIPCETNNKVDEDKDGKVNDGCPQVLGAAESGAQCDNAESDDGEDSDVNDGCPQNGDQSEGARIPGGCSGEDEGGCFWRANNASGDYTVTILTASQRDADGDGIENSLDVCSTDFNPGWNPRGPDPTNDPDNDGLPNECDPDDAVASQPSAPALCPETGIVGPDEDQDCFSNRQDNCPVDSQLEGGVPLIPDKDGDGIGDKCDPNPDNPNGELAYICMKFPLALGSPAGPVTAVFAEPRSLDCAVGASGATPEVVGAASPPPGATPRGGAGAGTGTGTGTGTGVGSGTTGVGSLSPVANDVPVWAAVLAGIGGLGVIFGLGLLTRSAVRRRIR